jgi:hypothetical protein
VRAARRSLALALLAATAGAFPAQAAPLPLGGPLLNERRTTRAVAPGLTWTTIVRARSATGPRTSDRWSVNVLSVDRSRLTGRMGGLLSNDLVPGLEPVSSIGRRAGAVAGVNASFYVASGDPAGVLSTPGGLVSEPISGRSALLIPRSPGARVTIGPLSFAGSVTIEGRSRYLDGVDRQRGQIPNCGGRGGDVPTQLPRFAFTCTDASELVVLSSRFGARTLTGPAGVEAVVRSGAVTSVRTGGNTAIPRGGYVLSGSGDAATFLRAAARPGARVSLSTTLARGATRLTPGAYDAVVSGGPRLLTGGRTTVASVAEGFSFPGGAALYGSFAARNPRTLAGVATGGRLLLVTVDGRRAGFSVGTSLSESAGVMRALGASDAMNLDGGGSTTMVVRGRVVNRPSDGRERAVSDGLFVLP